MRQTSTVLIVACWLLLSAVHAATYYVDYSGGSNNNAGTSIAAAWKHCPGDTNATGLAATNALSAGDTVKFKGGIWYTGMIKLDFSGTPNSPITYDGNSAGDWGGGRAVIAAPDATKVYFNFDDQSQRRSNIWLAGFLVSYSANPGVGRVGVGLHTGSRDIVITNCVFNAIGFATNMAGITANDINSTAIYLENTPNIKIADCEFTRMFRGVAVRSTSLIRDIEITGCDFHNHMIWLVDMAVAASGAVVSNINVHHNTFRDFNEFNSGCWLGSGEKPHADGVYLRADGAGGPTTWVDINIHGNTFYQGATSCSGGTAMIFIVGGPGANIFNNTFTHVVQSDAAISIDHQKQASGTQVVNIFNNTFMDNTRAIYASAWTPASERQINVLNNIFFLQSLNSSTVMCDIESATNLTAWDYNLYYKTGAGSIAYINGGGGWMTFADLQSNGWELHGLFADPLFVDSSHDVTVAPEENNLELQSGSPAIGAGAVLGGIFDVDRNGVSRGSSPDLGAYQYVAASGEPINRIWGNVTVHGTAEGK